MRRISALRGNLCPAITLKCKLNKARVWLHPTFDATLANRLRPFSFAMSMAERSQPPVLGQSESYLQFDMTVSSACIRTGVGQWPRTPSQ